MTETITRRSVLTTGILSALGVLAAPTLPVFAAPEPAAAIERAEALLAELIEIMPQLSERDQSNLSHVCDLIGRAGGLRADLVDGALDDALGFIGAGNRVHDRMDANAAAARRVAVTHAAVVEHYAEVYGTGEVGQIGTRVRQELSRSHGEELGDAIADAAFDLHLHRKYHSDDEYPGCCAVSEVAEQS